MGATSILYFMLLSMSIENGQGVWGWTSQVITVQLPVAVRVGGKRQGISGGERKGSSLVTRVAPLTFKQGEHNEGDDEHRKQEENTAHQEQEKEAREGREIATASTSKQKNGLSAKTSEIGLSESVLYKILELSGLLAWVVRFGGAVPVLEAFPEMHTLMIKLAGTPMITVLSAGYAAGLIHITARPEHVCCVCVCVCVLRVVSVSE